MKRWPAPLALLTALAACGGGTTTGPGGDGDGIANMSAKIDNVLWRPSFAVTAINAAPGLYSITAARISASNNYTMVFALYNVRGTGTYALGAGVNTFGGTGQLSQPPSNGWSTPLNGAAGEFKITTLTATRMVAEFKFDTETLPPGSAVGPKVTEGVLDIPVSGTGGLALANQGSLLTGTVGGPFNAAAMAGSITNAGGANPILTLVANNGLRSITMSIANMTGPGVYTLSSTTPVRTIGVGGAPGNLFASWSSQTAGGSGTVEILSVTASRVIGNFNATVVPLGGGATGSLAVSGNFEMARLF
ncbi:MAG: hypothetical protein HOP28_05820 [Gemmatimonadales bacterium]|nr:hypothetical protein [Gemmatimonadales bacterium]